MIKNAVFWGKLKQNFMILGGGGIPPWFFQGGGCFLRGEGIPPYTPLASKSPFSPPSDCPLVTTQLTRSFASKNHERLFHLQRSLPKKSRSFDQTENILQLFQKVYVWEWHVFNPHELKIKKSSERWNYEILIYKLIYAISRFQRS